MKRHVPIFSRWIVSPSQLSGAIALPPSKSQTIRALLFGLLARGKSTLFSPLDCPEMIKVCRQFGCKVDVFSDRIEIEGRNGNIQGVKEGIDAGNSGLILRFIGALAALSSEATFITGDHSIQNNRLIEPLLNGLNQLGAEALSVKANQMAPILVRGPLKPGKAVIEGKESQPISALLIAGAFSPGPTELFVTNPGELPWVNLTLDWFKQFHILYESQKGEYYRVEGGASIEGFMYRVPSDFSSLAFPLAAAILTNSELRIENLDFNDPQGDQVIISLLQKMGAKIEIGERHLSIKKGSHLKGMKIEINQCIDALPILAVIGCYAKGETEIVGGSIARKKECDRIQATANELKKMGGMIEEREDGLLIRYAPLRGASVYSYHDHRMALSLAVAGLVAEGVTEIQDVACASKTYPHFKEQMQGLGAQIQ